MPDISTASNPHSITGGGRRDSGSVVTFPRAGVYPLDPRRFIKAFRNALLLRPVENPTDFVRNYVLDVPTIKVDRLRRSIELYRFLTGKIDGLKAQTASGCLAIIHRPAPSAVAELAQWLARGDTIRHLEQEALDPVTPLGTADLITG